MSIRDLREKLDAELADAKLKVETTYCELVESGGEKAASLEQEYLDAIDELNAKLAEVKLAARSLADRFGKKFVVGGVIVLGIIAVGYIVGWYAV